MDPTIQLIQLTLRIECEMEARCRPSTVHRDDFADNKTVHPSRQENRVGGNFRLLHRQPQCECA